MKRNVPLRHRFPGIASIVRNGLMLTGTHWAEAGLRGVYAIFIARLLGPELYGVWSFATTTYAFVLAFAFFGLETLIPLRLGKDRNAVAFLETTFLVRLGLLGLIALGLAVYALGFENDPAVALALLIVLPALIGRGLVLWARTVFLGLDQSGQAFRKAVLLRSVEIAAGLTCLAFGIGIFGLLVVHTVAWLLEALWSFMALNRQFSFEMRLDRDELKRLLKKGTVLGVSTAALAALTSVPLIQTRYLTGDLTTIGQLALATQIAALAVMGAQGVLSAALPVLARASSKSDPRLAQYPLLVASAVLVVFGLVIPVAYFWGPVAISALIGSDFDAAGTLLAPALLVGGLSVLPVGFVQVLVTQNRLWPGVVAGWLSVLALLILLPVTVGAAGAQGALIAAALAWGLRAVIVIVWALVVRATG